jgi:hypothetical protein
MQGAGEDDATRVARRQCEAVRDAVRQGNVEQGLMAADAIDSTVLQVWTHMDLSHCSHTVTSLHALA